MPALPGVLYDQPKTALPGTLRTPGSTIITCGGDTEIPILHTSSDTMSCS